MSQKTAAGDRSLMDAKPQKRVLWTLIATAGVLLIAIVGVIRVLEATTRSSGHLLLAAIMAFFSMYVFFWLAMNAFAWMIWGLHRRFMENDEDASATLQKASGSDSDSLHDVRLP